MKKPAWLVVGFIMLNLLSRQLAWAADFDFLNFAKQTILPCAHPTAPIEKAKLEFAKEPKEEGNLTKTRVKIFYEGWLKKNAMLVEIVLRKCCEGALLVKVEVLEESAGTGTMQCKYFSGGWFDIEPIQQDKTNGDRLKQR